jgi:hypothetical protein
MTRYSQNAAAHFMECVQTANCRIGLGIGSVQGHGDGVEEFSSAAGVFGQRETRRQQPQFEAFSAQQFGDRRPFGVEERLATRQEHHLSMQPRETRQ